MTDERIRRAEELLGDRLRERQNGPATASDDASADETSLAKRVEELTAALQRERADFANYRRRNESERADYARYAKAEVITKLLEVLDNFDRALETVPGDLGEQPWVEGIWLVERKLRQILADEGLREVSSVGQPFDPNFHEAIGYVPSSAPEGTVVDEVRKAYRLHDKIIRPALVTVAQGPDQGHKEDN